MNLPEKWINVCLEDLAADIDYPIGDGDHGQIKPSSYTNNGVPYIRVADMGWGRFEPKNLVYIPEEIHSQNLKSELKPGDVLIAKTGATIGKCCIVPETIEKANTSSSVGKVTLNNEITCPKWVLYYFLSKEFKEQMWAVSEKTAQPGFGNRDLKKFIIPLAPFNEQKRIVRKLDRIVAKMESCQKRLDKIPAILKRLRQAVLAAACSGRLTEDWREKKGLEFNGYKKLSDWKNIQINTGPFGSTIHKKDYIENGVPLINPIHIKDCRINPSFDITVSNEKADELKRYRLIKDDIVLARRGEMGRAAKVTEKEEGYLCGTGSMFIRIKNKELHPDFLVLTLSSPAIIQYLNSFSVGSTMININQRIVSGLEILDCKLDEQQEIVRRTEGLLELADKIEARFIRAQEYVNKLTQSILSKAFRGELVPQDPNDEPASVLLERIRKEKKMGAGSRAVGESNRHVRAGW